MLALKKQRTVSYLQTLASSPPLQGENRSSQPSLELSSSEVCLEAEKMRESEGKWSRRKEAGKLKAFPPILLMSQKNSRFDYSVQAYILPQQSKITKINKGS